MKIVTIDKERLEERLAFLQSEAKRMIGTEEGKIFSNRADEILNVLLVESKDVLDEIVESAFEKGVDSAKENCRIIPTPYRMVDDDFTTEYYEDAIEKEKQNCIKKAGKKFFHPNNNH